MAHFDARSAECLVFTYKEGLLSAVAHNLKIRVTKFRIEIDESTRAITASFDAASLRVVSALSDADVELQGALTTANKREIEANIVRDVLESRTYPEIGFVSTGVREKGDAYTVKGTLTLHGTARQISVRVHREDQGYRAEARIHQPDFGIRPYRALLGTLKVQADVTVRVTVPGRPAAD